MQRRQQSPTSVISTSSIFVCWWVWSTWKRKRGFQSWPGELGGWLVAVWRIGFCLQSNITRISQFLTLIRASPRAPAWSHGGRCPKELLMCGHMGAQKRFVHCTHSLVLSRWLAMVLSVQWLSLSVSGFFVQIGHNCTLIAIKRTHLCTCTLLSLAIYYLGNWCEEFSASAILGNWAM